MISVIFAIGCINLFLAGLLTVQAIYQNSWDKVTKVLIGLNAFFGIANITFELLK